jgi:adenosylmethionine-8-amino-7-oxononanoate aminotransferase
VALESLRLFDDERRLERVASLERLFAERLGGLRGHPGVAEVRGIGAVAAVELATKGGGYLDDVGPRAMRWFLDRGILLRPLGNVIYFLPPYVVSDDDAHRVFDEVERFLDGG